MYIDIEREREKLRPAKGGPEIYLLDDCVVSFVKKRQLKFKCKCRNELLREAATGKDQKQPRDSKRCKNQSSIGRERPSAAHPRPALRDPTRAAFGRPPFRNDCSNKRTLQDLFVL